MLAYSRAAPVPRGIASRAIELARQWLATAETRHYAAEHSRPAVALRKAAPAPFTDTVEDYLPEATRAAEAEATEAAAIAAADPALGAQMRAAETAAWGAESDDGWRKLAPIAAGHRARAAAIRNQILGVSR